VSIVFWVATALMGGRAFAGQSVVLVPGTTGTFNIPSSVPFTTLGDTRLELRLHDWTVPAAETSLFDTPSHNIRMILTPYSEVCAEDYVDSLPSYGGRMCADITGKADVVVRVQRDTIHKLLELEAYTTNRDWTATTYCGWKANGTQGNTFPCPISTVNLTSWAGAGAVGAAGTSGKLAWVKWSSTLVETGSPLYERTSADLADWRFEGSGNDASPHGLNISITASYVQSPRYPPVCSAGRQQVFRAGFSGTLDGTKSYPLDDGETLAYLWQQRSGPSRVFWTSQSATRPAITGMIFGSYVLQLTVTDGSGQSTACTVKHGAVAADDDGVVITDNPAVDVILGPQIRYGANPWPWYDDRHKAAADLQAANLSTYYLPAYWDVAATGTVTVTTSSTAVVGSGTTFTTTFCQGPGSPTVPKSSATIIVWYPTGTPGETGRKVVPVTNCIDDTHLTTRAWSGIAAGSGLSYSYSDDTVSGRWDYGSAPQNYYDNVLAFYSLYYRSGLDDYLTAARVLADLWWRDPHLDRGRTCDGNAMNGDYCIPPRSQSMTGLFLRALDGKADMWPGLRIMEGNWMWYLANYDKTYGTIWDLREEAYHLAFTSICALADPDPTSSAACKSAVGASFADVWKPYRAADGGWHTLYYSAASWTPMVTSATLTHGSATVTGVGTSWTRDQVLAQPVIWFTNATSKPASNSDGDNTYYVATWVSETQLTLDRAYEGSSGSHGWMLSADSVVAKAVGYGQQPFMMGIAATAFGLAAKAMEDGSYSPTLAALAHSYNEAAVNWIKTFGYWPLKKSLYYFAQYVNCQAPISDSDTRCTAGNDESQSRTLSAEVVRGIGMAYMNTNDGSLKTFGDTLYSAMFSKPATGGPNPDGFYISDLDTGTGWYMIGTPPIGQSPKWFGLFFGFGGLSAWPAYRLAGGQPAVLRSIAVGLAMETVPNATEVVITITEPSGKVSQTACSASPCEVTIDQNRGDPLIRFDYRSSSSALLVPSETTILSAR
jgi:hypothetical protein